MPVVEFLGLAYTYTGVRELSLAGATLGELLLAIGQQSPRFQDRCPTPGQLPVGIVACINERQFTRDSATPLSADDRVLLTSADVGG